jgi:hypothetical protein
LGLECGNNGKKKERAAHVRIMPALGIIAALGIKPAFTRAVEKHSKIVHQ